MQTIRINEILTGAGLEITPARTQVLGVCIAKSTPLTVAEVAEAIGGKAHLATVYRTLEKFVSAGILERIDFQEGKFRYEFSDHHHHHAVCTDCGKIEEIQTPALERATQEITSKSGFMVTKHMIELFGICHGCQPKESYVT